MFAGGIGGFGAAIALYPLLEPQRCGCDEPGLNEGFVGGLVGLAVGSTLGAALPRLGSTCSVGARLIPAEVGSILGLIAGSITVNRLRDTQLSGLAWTALAMPPLGATIGAQLCQGQPTAQDGATR
jgi:hypothetical protein